MRAVITGALGQDGRLLGALLRSRGIDVVGLVRAGCGADESLAAAYGLDISDDRAMWRVLDEIQPDHIYHLAACHHSSERDTDPLLDREMVATNFRSTEAMLSWIAARGTACRLLVAGSSQMYRPVPGQCLAVSEVTPMDPGTFYGFTKAWSRELVAYYRDKRNVFGSTAILFNHESPLRGSQYVTRKISIAAARAKLQLDHELHLIDVTSQVDWTSAKDVVQGMFLALLAVQPDDYVYGSGTAHTVQDVLETAFGHVGLEWRRFTTFGDPPDPSRGILVADADRAARCLGWRPQVGFAEMIREMVDFDLARLSGSALPGA